MWELLCCETELAFLKRPFASMTNRQRLLRVIPAKALSWPAESLGKFNSSVPSPSMCVGICLQLP